jgi:glycosyltransferase involved in cell wall biosynthesis
MKIIHFLLGKANPDTMNGVNKVVHNLATEQLKSDIDVEVWGITMSPDIVRHRHDYSLRLFHAKKVRFSLDKSLKSAIQSLPSNSIAHFHSVFLPELYAVSRELKKRSIPWVISPHCGYLPQAMRINRHLKSLYMFFVEKHLLTQACALHAIGANEIDALKRIAPSQKIVLIPNGQEIQDVHFTQQETRQPEKHPLFVFCGRLATAHKGLDLLIQAFSLYKKDGGEGELWLIGSGPDRLYLEKLTKSLITGHDVKFLGPIFGNEKLAYLSKTDIFVHTSRWEGIPTAVLEAAALAKPLLVSAETNMGDYIERHQCGFVLYSNTPKHISVLFHKTDKLYKNECLKKIGENALNMINNELNWRSINKKIVTDLYNIDLTTQ